MKKFIIGLVGVIFASVMVVSISSCGEDPIEEIDKEQVDDEKEETGKETSQIVGVWKKGGVRTIIKFKDDGTGYTEHNGDFEWFAYTFNSKTNVITITDGIVFEDDIDRFKIRFIEDNIIQLGWWSDGEWYWESDEIYYRQNNSDNEEEEEGESSTLIVGTWKSLWEDGYGELMINSNMTVLYNELDDGIWDSRNELYKCVYDKDNNIIYFYDYYTGKPTWEPCHIVSITKTEMRTLDFLDSGIIVWKRQ